MKDCLVAVIRVELTDWFDTGKKLVNTTSYPTKTVCCGTSKQPLKEFAA